MQWAKELDAVRTPGMTFVAKWEHMEHMGHMGMWSHASDVFQVLRIGYQAGQSIEGCPNLNQPNFT